MRSSSSPSTTRTANRGYRGIGEAPGKQRSRAPRTSAASIWAFVAGAIPQAAAREGWRLFLRLGDIARLLATTKKEAELPWNAWPPACLREPPGCSARECRRGGLLRLPEDPRTRRQSGHLLQ